MLVRSGPKDAFGECPTTSTPRPRISKLVRGSVQTAVPHEPSSQHLLVPEHTQHLLKALEEKGKVRRPTPVRSQGHLHVVWASLTKQTKVRKKIGHNTIIFHRNKHTYHVLGNFRPVDILFTASGALVFSDQYVRR